MSSLSELRGYHSLEALVRRARGRKLRGIGWPSLGRAAAQILTIGIAWVVFADVQDREPTIIIALLGLAYAGLRADAVAHRTALRRIADILKGSFASQRQEGDPVGAAQNTRVTPADRAAWLDYAGLALLGLICLYHLGIAILYGAALQQILELN